MFQIKSGSPVSQFLRHIFVQLYGAADQELLQVLVDGLFSFASQPFPGLL